MAECGEFRPIVPTWASGSDEPDEDSDAYPPIDLAEFAHTDQKLPRDCSDLPF